MWPNLIPTSHLEDRTSTTLHQLQCRCRDKIMPHHYQVAWRNLVPSFYIDEIKHFQDGRWVSAQEAFWRMYEFKMNETTPPVISLQLHLPDKQSICYWQHRDLRDVIGSERSSKTMLTEFFTKCTTTENARKFLYVEFPEHYVWSNQAKIWSDRKHKLVIGRINAANPKEGERYYLRLLLNHVRGPTSWEYLLTVDGIAYKSFKEAAQKRGLLEADDSISDCLVEATTFQMPYALRRLFAIILVYCQPSNVRKLWNDHFEAMAEDFKGGVDEYMLPARVAWTLKSISLFLESMGKHIADYDLPLLIHDDVDQCQTLPREIIDEREIDIPFEDFHAQSKLNPRQKQAFDIILDRVNKKKSGIFFVDGPGGTGKTFLYRALLANLRSRKMIALATATSGVAAAIMPGGRTAHSRFKIPITANETTMCNISKQDGTSKLIRLASLIIWDEAPMAKRFAIETVDRTLRDVMGDKRFFGGKVVVFGGDFRQVLPVVPRGTRAETINASLVKSYLWEKNGEIISHY
ncbi:uncharacterized protein LOC109846336 [Asparagus officinalis]|uniref:uncharacterized protein LOC109846336 n=1 Tax=Asparagus officinalis TaxID=4686 RepID=UPI00098E04A1|nr:uncharacterized protein LOC109846336 [Asparagus officinalis]